MMFGAPCFFLFSSKRLQSYRKPRWNHKTCSQALFLSFMMQLEQIVRQTEKHPFHFDLDSAPEHESPKSHIFFRHGKYTLGLNASIDTDQLSFV